MRVAVPFAVALSLALVTGCAALKPTVSPSPNMYSLSGSRTAATLARSGPPFAAGNVTLMVSPPHAAAGYDSPRMMYTRRPGLLEYFAQNEWIDTPARMLAPLVVAAIRNGGAFRAVVQMPSSAGGELRLDTEILQLQQDFLAMPSQVRFTLRAYLVESATRRVVATREFEATFPADGDNPRGGAAAANRAVQVVLEKLAAFCTEAVAVWQPPGAEILKRAEGPILFRR